MVSRLGDAAHNFRINSFVQSTQTRIRDNQTSIATGKQAQSFAEISESAAFLVVAREDMTVDDTFSQQNNINLDRMRAMDRVIGNIGDVLEKMRVLMVQRLNGATGDDVPVAGEADSAMAEVAARLNTELDGRYLFSGTSTDQQSINMPPVINSAADLVGIYGGDRISQTMRVDRDIEIDVGLTGDEFVPVLETLADLKAAHIADDDAALRAGYDDLGTLIDQLADMRGELGAKTARVEAIQETQFFAVGYYEETISRIEDTDIPFAVSKLAQDEVTIQAAYLTISRLNQLSLADYIR